MFYSRADKETGSSVLNFIETSAETNFLRSVRALQLFPLGEGKKVINPLSKFSFSPSEDQKLKPTTDSRFQCYYVFLLFRPPSVCSLWLTDSLFFSVERGSVGGGGTAPPAAGSQSVQSVSHHALQREEGQI